jgi:hypothetical protein
MISSRLFNRKGRINNAPRALRQAKSVLVDADLSLELRKMLPRIVKSELTKPPRWYVVTRYVEKHGMDVETGEERAYIVASKKYDVTDQMEVILCIEKNNIKGDDGEATI